MDRGDIENEQPAFKICRLLVLYLQLQIQLSLLLSLKLFSQNPLFAACNTDPRLLPPPQPQLQLPPIPSIVARPQPLTVRLLSARTTE